MPAEWLPVAPCVYLVPCGAACGTGKGKRWKPLYFILEGSDAQLIYFESEKRATKPKGLIDLSVCYVYGVHDSLFDRSGRHAQAPGGVSH